MRGVEVEVSIDDIEKQSLEARKLYEEIWRLEERKNSKTYNSEQTDWRRDRVLEGNRKDEIDDIIRMVKDIAMKYEKFEIRQDILDTNRAILEFEQKIALIVKKLLLSLVIKKLVYAVPIRSSRICRERMERVSEIMNDLKRLYELGKRWANITGYPPLWLLTLEAEYLRSLSLFRIHRWLRLEIKGFGMKVYLSSYKRDRRIKVKLVRDFKLVKKIVEINRVPVCHAVREIVVDERIRRAVKVVLTNKTHAREYDIQGVITCLGDAKASELPILTVVSYILDNDGRPVRIEMDTCFL